MRTQRTKKLVGMAIMAAIAGVLMYIEFPIPGIPPFLKLDISGVPVLVGSFMYGPVAGVAIAAVKSMLHLFGTTSAGIGELADFLMTASFAFTAGIIYLKNKSRKGALIGAGAGIVVLTLVGVVANHFLIIPFYSQLMPIDAIIQACNAVNPAIKDMSGYLLFGVVPFNLLKGVVLSVITVGIYKRISVLFKAEGTSKKTV
ncbi:ECF transporter S component [Ruminococcaceae bacterium OttesenSCG-928-A16]|nr:ECF transporter S component [Ruminococcaceae bacterium OttesenSCG-928-A16]